MRLKNNARGDHTGKNTHIMNTRNHTNRQTDLTCEHNTRESSALKARYSLVHRQMPHTRPMQAHHAHVPTNPHRHTYSDMKTHTYAASIKHVRTSRFHRHTQLVQRMDRIEVVRLAL